MKLDGLQGHSERYLSLPRFKPRDVQLKYAVAAQNEELLRINVENIAMESAAFALHVRKVPVSYLSPKVRLPRHACLPDPLHANACTIL